MPQLVIKRSIRIMLRLESDESFHTFGKFENLFLLFSVLGSLELRLIFVEKCDGAEDLHRD